MKILIHPLKKGKKPIKMSVNSKSSFPTSGEGYKLLNNADGSLMLKKLHALFPVMFLNYVSIMVMTSVDSIVVGWGIGEKAVASVSYFLPFDYVMGALVALISNGVATLMSKQLGVNDAQSLNRDKKAILYMTLIVSLVLGIVQIPICLTMFHLYHMDEAVLHMALRYAIFNMIATPFSIANTIGTYLLMSIGRAKVIFKASLLQSGANVLLDVLFVIGFDMSTDGVGLGTLCATILYFGYILHHLLRHSEFLKIDRSVDCRKEMLDIVRYGVPSLTTSISDAIFSAAIFWFISYRMRDTGIAIHSVCLFAGSFITIITLSLRASLQPLSGMLSTIGDATGMDRLLKLAFRIYLLLSGVVFLAAQIYPQLFFDAYGLKEVSPLGYAAMRAYSLQFLLAGLNSLLRLYFNTWDDVRFSSVHGSLNAVFLPAIFAGGVFLLGGTWSIWLCYVLADLICFFVAWGRYHRRTWNMRKAVKPNDFNLITHPDLAPDTAAQLENILLQNGISPSHANRVALCVEEIGAYALPAKEGALVTIQLYACINEDETTVIMLDDGKCVAFPEDMHENVLVTTNYEMLKRISSECNYDYVLELNRFTVKLQNRAA